MAGAAVGPGINTMKYYAETKPRRRTTTPNHVPRRGRLAGRTLLAVNGGLNS